MTYLNLKNLASITKLIKQGNVVAMPTDTVFGLLCLINNEAAINKIYQIKNRSIEKPLPIIVANWTQAKKIGIFNQELIQYLENNFIKGQVTVIVKKQLNLNKINYWKKWDTVAIRVTNSNYIKKIISKTGCLVATSCNTSNQPTINDSKQINLPFLEYIVEGKLINSKASTIYDSIHRRILRP